MGGVMGWLWEALEELMEEGQDWMVVTLVGELTQPLSLALDLAPIALPASRHTPRAEWIPVVCVL